MIHISRVTQASQELVEVFEKLIPQLSQRKPPSLDELTSLINSQSVVLIARYPESSSSVVGSGTLAVFPVPTGLRGHIEDVVVDQSARGNGIGEAIVSDLLIKARELGIQGVSLTCNPTREAANRMYLNMGFQLRETNVYWYDLRQ